MKLTIAFLFFLACTPSPAPQNDVVTLPTSTPTPPAVKVERRCLPVVAKACGCVYSCGVGVPADAADTWTVTHPFWKPMDLRAKIEPWCVDGNCTEAFSAEIVCDAICSPKPADSTCHFDAAGACVGVTP